MVRNCTIFMRLGQFESDCLHNLTSDFASNVSDAIVRKVWWSFNEDLGKDGALEMELEKPEAKYARVWSNVNRGQPLCPGFDFHTSTRAGDDGFKQHGYFVLPQDLQECPPAAYAQYAVEFKPNGPNYDPFRVGDTPSSDVSEIHDAVLEDLQSNAKEVMNYQHRTALFMLFVYGEWFRVMRWDPAGIVVTEEVNYARRVEGTRALLRVLYGFSKLSSEQQGHDLNAVRLSKSSYGYRRMDILARARCDDLDYEERVLLKTSNVHPSFFDPATSSNGSEPAASQFDELVHHDPTDPVLPSAEPQFARVGVSYVMTHVREAFRKAVRAKHPRYRIRVDGKDFLVGEPLVSGEVPLGKAMRGYIALEWLTQRFVFLKDTWEPLRNSWEREGAIIAKLNASGVPSVPTLVAHEDVHHLDGVRMQVTLTDRYSGTFGNKVVQELPPFPNPKDTKAAKPVMDDRLARKLPSDTRPRLGDCSKVYPATMSNAIMRARPDSDAPMPFPMVLAQAGKKEGLNTGHNPPTIPIFHKILGRGSQPRVHTRIVLKEFCLSLNSVSSSRQLVRLIYEAMIAHEQAYTRCHYIHHDISSGNILAYPVFMKMPSGRYAVFWKAILSDWGYAMRTDIALPPKGSTRTGTRAYMSVYQLHMGLYNHNSTIADEMEAFLHVLVHNASKSMKSNIVEVDEFLNSYFLCSPKDPLNPENVCQVAKRCSIMHCGSLTVTGIERITFSPRDYNNYYDKKRTLALNRLIAQLMKLFQTRYIVWQWRTDAGRDIEARDSKPPQHVFDSAASLKTHEGVRSLVGKILLDDSLFWPAWDMATNNPYKYSRVVDVMKAADFADYLAALPNLPAPKAEKVQEASVEEVQEARAEEVQEARADKAQEARVSDQDQAAANADEDARPQKRRRIERTRANNVGANANVPAASEPRVTRSRSAAQIRVTRSKAGQGKAAEAGAAGGSRAGKGRKGTGAAGRPRRR
ncbi:hypothetical protein L226DRAFT_517845 [Lentinus tigrinus ALCF2SS1-7]|uniref:Fungal-type protein kinase domain-containing protein n=1 Tax=Lentinus tigrinus ALCF2SS1-6 TaxID=1328759 RepID=A0A5C2RQF8_9APHY|nr:hypothetical protein L227DRAFT_658010 [Lentinus tigrinus ALCF2SS1-6]RPD67706.1 hypothetical protein L226DRAFT_517845 [Lentinus tigrinus ALCF2SS1-7]